MFYSTGWFKGFTGDAKAESLHFGPVLGLIYAIAK
jgi:hypothetical protein